METKVLVAGYIRVSTAIQAEEGESLSTQRQQIENYVKQQQVQKKDWILTNIYADEGATGRKIDYRIQFQELMNDAKKRKFDVVLFTKVSRFGRNTRDFLNAVHELEQIGVQLISIKENFDSTTPYGKMILTMLAGFAEWEHETIREQMFESKSARWSKGEIFLGSTPFGYLWNPAIKKLELNPKEAPIYLEIVKMCAKQNMSFRDIAIELNFKRLTPDRVLKDGKVKLKKPWAPNTVSRIIKNTCYYGHYVVNKTMYEDGSRGAGTKHTSKPKPASQHITFNIEPLVTKQEWDKMQEVIRHHKLIPKHTNESTLNSFLRSVLVCGRCGSRMIVKQGSKKKDGTIMRYYACYWASPGNKDLQFNHKKCDLPYISADKVEKEVWWRLRLMFHIDAPESRAALNNIIDSDSSQDTIDRLAELCLKLEHELGQIKKKHNRIKMVLDDDNFDKDEFSIELQKNDNEKLTIEGKLRTTQGELAEKRKLKQDAERLKQFLTQNADIFEVFEQGIRQLSLIDRKLLVESMLDGDIILDWVPENQSYKDPLAFSRKGKQAPGLQTHCRFNINPEILNRFIDEGKIVGLNNNSSKGSD